MSLIILSVLFMFFFFFFQAEDGIRDLTVTGVQTCALPILMDTEAFREFKTGLTLLRDNYAMKALPHMRRAVDLDKNNPYYMSYLGVVLARSERKWGEAERLCDSAVRMKRNQAQLYLNLAEVYAAAGRRDDAVDALQTGLKYARRDIRLTIAMNKLTPRRSPVLGFLGRRNALNRQLGILRHRAMRLFGPAAS